MHVTEPISGRLCLSVRRNEWIARLSWESNGFAIFTGADARAIAHAAGQASTSDTAGVILCGPCEMRGLADDRVRLSFDDGKSVVDIFSPSVYG